MHGVQIVDIGEFTVLIAGTSSKDEGAKCDPPLPPPPQAGVSLCLLEGGVGGSVFLSQAYQEQQK